MSSSPPALQLRLRDGLTIAVPPQLSAITTYVLLEQERWFEKEIDFLRRFLVPGMTAIDIGANLGVYSLAMAQLVGAQGRVFAYEPGSEARDLLRQSRALNGFAWLDISASALSDSARQGHLAHAASSELRALDAAGAGEPVAITTLDREAARHGWTQVDFIKIDAEGEEERILAGGRDFFARQSPLVMFEIKAGNSVNERLRTLFPAIGYRLFRQLAGAAVLVPDDRSQPLDSYELNLFAAKPDRASALAKRNLLAEAVADWQPGEQDRRSAPGFLRAQPFFQALKLPPSDALSADAAYRDALAAYAAWRDASRPAAMRAGALSFALRNLRDVCARAPTAERLSTAARVAWEWGARSDCVALLQRLLAQLTSGPVEFREPLLPPNPRFDDIPAAGAIADWLGVAAAEQLERAFAFSSVFGGATPLLPWLCSQPTASTEMERRRVLIVARQGHNPQVPERLCHAAPDHLNADIWKSGRVRGVTGR